MSRRRLAALLAAVGMLAAGPAPERAGFEHPERPTLIALGSRAGLAAQAPRFRALLATDGLLDLRVGGRTVPEDAPDGADLGPWLRRRWGLGRFAPVWVLVARDGRVLASGRTLPGPEPLVQALEAAGEPSRVTRLERFLAAHPDHAEARLDLILALRPRLCARLQVQPPASDRDLTPEEDVQVWGPLARQLDLLLSMDAGIGPDLDRILAGPEVPERASPLMKALYRRHRPRLLVRLQRFPVDGPGWSSLLRMDRALGDPLLGPALAAVAWFQVRPVETPLLPYRPLGERLLAEARRSGDWPPARIALRSLWTRLARPKLAFFAKGSLGSDPDRASFWARVEREELWDRLLAPLIEATVRAGFASEVPALLAELDTGWAAAGLEGRVRRLARALGRADLVPAWVASVRTLPPPLPRAGLLAHELLLCHQGQDLGATDPDRLAAPWQQRGVDLGLEPADPDWVRHLGWTGPGPRWALVDRSGGILLQGLRLAPWPELWAAFRDLGLPTGPERVAAFRAEHPDHLGALAAEVRLRAVQAWAHLEGREPGAPMGGPEREAWQDCFASLGRLLEDPQGLGPGPLRQANPDLPPPSLLGPGGAAPGADLAQRWLPRLEEQLARRPSDPGLWRLWLGLAAFLDRPLPPLLDSLVPSPLTPPGAWPPPAVLAQAAAGLQAQARWQDLVDLLQPRWEARRAAVTGHLCAGDPEARHGYARGWSWQLTRPLLEAQLRLGRAGAADAILEALGAVGEGPGACELDGLCRVATEAGAESWVRRWRPQRARP